MERHIIFQQGRRAVSAFVFLALGFAFIFSATGYGDAISGVTIENYSSHLGSPYDRRPEYLVGTAGFEPTGPGTHTTTPDGCMWMCAVTGNIAAEYVTFDLGAVYDLAGTRIWNYNENAPWNQRAVHELRILVSSDNVMYRDLGVYVLDQGPASACSATSGIKTVYNSRMARSIRRHTAKHGSS
jgi:hypothetical protein